MRIWSRPAVWLLALLSLAVESADPALAARVRQITRASSWTRVAAIPVRFDTFHPQGMVKIGDSFFVSSVDKTKGQGHLFKIDRDGGLVADLPLGQGQVFHPGGIDYDGKDIWVPVAEYRPDSSAVIYRVNPAAMKATEVLRVADHIGAVVHDTDAHAIYGVSWGSRRLYRWKLDANGRIAEAALPKPAVNPSHYVDYQDCKYVGGGQMLCTGVTEIRRSPLAAPFRLGGIELVDLAAGRPVHQVPVLLWTDTGYVMTQNPVWMEATAAGVRAWFMPEDDRSTIYVYECASMSVS